MGKYKRHEARSKKQDARCRNLASRILHLASFSIGEGLMVNKLSDLWENVLVALDGLAANKLRAALTMLGVIIGVGSVIALMSIGGGRRNRSRRRSTASAPTC
jgi:hypothetical protein